MARDHATALTAGSRHRHRRHSPRTAGGATAATARRRDARPAWAWLALAFATASVFLWQSSQHEVQHWAPGQALTLQLGGQRYGLEREDLTGIRRFSLEWLEAGDARAREHGQARVDAELDAVFARLHERVPEVADAYYSLGAEYARLWAQGTQWLGTSAGTDPAGLLREQLLPDNLWEHPLRERARRVEWGVDEHQRQVRDAWQLELAARLEAARIPALPPRATAAQETEVERGYALHGVLDGEMERLERRGQLAASAATGAGLAAPLLARAVQTHLATNATRAGMARRLTGAGRAGLLGAGLCAWTGPFAVGCGLAAGSAAIVGLDWALLALDEARHRAELESALHKALDNLQAETRDAWHKALEDRIEARHAASREAIQRAFQPWNNALSTPATRD